jgi:hypothetical protein
MALQTRWIRIVAVACALAAWRSGSLAQSPPDVPRTARVADSVATGAFDISGTWDGVFTLDSAWQLPQRATARTVRARIQFSPVGDATAVTSSSRSVHPGMFAIDFSRFGFTLSTQESLGWSTNPDSIRAVLNPTVDHGVVELHGRITGDSVAVGTWRYRSDPGGAHGTFRVQRARFR